MKNSFVVLYNMATNEEKEFLYYSQSPKRALINAIMQFNGNFNTFDYPENIPGIYKSKMVKDRLIYDLSDDLILYSQYV